MGEGEGWRRQRASSQKGLFVIVALDTGVLGLFCAPKENRELEQWAAGLLTRGRRIVIPDICDYELRREMVRLRAERSVERLDALAERFDYEVIRPEALRLAAEFWALVRNDGQKTADDAALDGDCVLAAQATLCARENGRPLVVATTNVKHLERVVRAQEWAAIS